MDPFTITTSVLRITTTCIDAAKSLNDIRNTWERAPVTVSSLCSQLKLTSASLSQIQVLILGENDILKDKPDLVETFDTTLTSCLVLSTWLDSIMQRITKGVLDGTKATWRMKFKTVWNESEIKELVEQLHTQQGAIGVLIGLLQMDSISEIRSLVRRHEALLQEIARNTRRSRTRHSIEAQNSILLTDEASSSILSKLATDARFDSPSREDNLKAVVLSSKASSPKVASNNLLPIPMDQYNAVKQTTARSRSRSRSPSANKVRSYDESHSDALRPDLPILNFVAVEQSFLAAKDQLLVSGVEASAWRTHLQNRPGELYLMENEELFQIRKANDYWCYCQKPHRRTNETCKEGLVERSNMVVRFMFSKPLRVHTTKTRIQEVSAKGNLVYKTGDILQLNGIHHAIFWFARRPTHDSKAPYEQINVLDIGLSDVQRKYVDSLLDFVSCPHPDLVDATGDELVQRMKKLLQGAGERKKHMWGRLFAHCRSFADLQVCARVVDEDGKDMSIFSPFFFEGKQYV